MPTVDTTQPIVKTFSREDSIRLRAEEIYRQRGNRPGSALEDWLQAERDVRAAEERMIDEAS